MQQQDNYERQKNATSMFPSHSNSSLMAQLHSALSLPLGTQFFGLFTSLTWFLDYISFQSTADIYWLPEILFVLFTITTAHILMWQIPTHQFVEFTESLGAEIQVVLFFIILVFSQTDMEAVLSVSHWPWGAGYPQPYHLPFAWKTLLKYKSLALNMFSLSLTPIFFNSLKRLLTPDREAEERAGLRPGPCGILSTVECPPRPNPRPPRSSRPHPPPSWSGAHTDTRSLIDCNQCGNTHSSKSSEDT